MMCSDPHPKASMMSPSLLLVTTVPITLEAFLLPFAQRFRALGWRVDGLANGASGVERLHGEFDNLHDVDWSRDPLHPANLIGTPADVRCIVKEGGYDLVHVHTPVAAFVTRYALRSRRDEARPTVIYTAHGFHFYAGQAPAEHAVFRGMERLAAPWTDYLVTINSEDHEAARHLGLPDPGRVRFIPGIGVDTERFSPVAVSAEESACVRADLDIAPDAFVLTCVAEFAPVKRHEHLLRAFAAADAPDALLLLVGDGPLEPRLRELVFALGIGDRVRWGGYRRDVPAVLAASDALVLTSEREGLNRSVLEAMASGVPVIGTRTRGIADAVGTHAGWIVDKNDRTALSAAISHAAHAPDELAARGAAARERAVREFSIGRVLDEYEGLYREALA